MPECWQFIIAAQFIIIDALKLTIRPELPFIWIHLTESLHPALAPLLSYAHCETISKFLTQLFSPPPLPFVFYLFNFVARFWFSFLSCACFYSRLWLQFNFNCFIRWCRSENSLKSIFIYQFLPTITAVNFDLFDIFIKM